MDFERCNCVFAVSTKLNKHLIDQTVAGLPEGASGFYYYYYYYYYHYYCNRSHDHYHCYYYYYYSW